MSTTLPQPATARPAPKRVGRGPVATLLRPLASLQLTVALMALSVGLVFFGTLAQKQAGIWVVVDQYFWSWVVLVDVNCLLEFTRIFFDTPPDLHAQSWAKIPWPGGKLIGGLMFANLLVAQFTRLKLTWKKAGVYLLHAGLMLLFVGEFVTREFQVEQQMQIPTGQTVGYAVDARNHELAFADTSDPAADRVTVVPARRLRAAAAAGTVIRHPDLPYDLKPTTYHTNATLAAVGGEANPATAGAGLRSRAVGRAETNGLETGDKFDSPAVYVTLLKKDTDEPAGTFLYGLQLEPQPLPGATGRTAELRFKHEYKPYTVRLDEFRFDRYPGTNKPRNYSSRVTVSDPERGGEFETTIAMNEPLRHRGETFYQQSFDKSETTTVLQVVRNPGWLLPYVACVVISLGMALQFTITLVVFLRKSVGPKPVAVAGTPWSPRRLVVPAVTLTLAAVALTGAARPVAPRSGKLDLSAAARLPVQEGGRIKPVDTVARVDLRLITHREEYTDAAGGKGPAVKWLFDAAAAGQDSPGPAAKYPIFRIENDQVLSLLQLKRREGLRYSVDEMRPRFDEFDAVAKKALDKQSASEKQGGPPLDLFENHVVELYKHVQTYLSVWQGFAPAVLPPAGGRTEWAALDGVRVPQAEKQRARDNVRAVVRAKLNAEGLPTDYGKLTPTQQQRVVTIFEQERGAVDARLVAEDARLIAADPAATAWMAVLDAYRANDPARFDAAVADFAELGQKALKPGDAGRVRLETTLNQTALFYWCGPFYGVAAVLGLAAWLCVLAYPPAAEPLRRASVWLMVGTLVVHTLTLVARMYLMDRPLVFVTNLYSTAVFIGWGAVVMGLLVERVLPLGVGAVLGAAVGVATCILAHNLAVAGDTLQMMEAVLDTNFWLATHVTTINLGYSASYLAGAVGLAYVVLGLVPREMGLGKPVVVGSGANARRMELGKAVGQALYGVVCLATLLSLVGTILGGIWGDQSWGRFWGWDPKENGALLIVVWNAMMLHARWCGLVRDRGMALLALAGNMIVTWSYFGTNQLGVGLHAYGFSKELVNVCWYMWVSHAAFIFVGLVPWYRLHGDGTKR